MVTKFSQFFVRIVVIKFLMREILKKRKRGVIK